MLGDIVIICPTQSEGIQYCADNDIEILRGAQARRAGKPKVRILYGQGGHGKMFSKRDIIHVLHSERLSRPMLEALLPCFYERDIPEELLTAFDRIKGV